MTGLLSKRWWPYLLLGLATLLVWGHTVTFGFVWDDEFFIHDLPAVRSLKNIPSMFYSIEAQATDPYLFRVFRPVRTAHYAVLYFLDGQVEPRPWIFHLANVLWHGATGMMLFAVLVLLLPKLRGDWAVGEARTWAWLMALGFTVHPVVSEVVCWAKSLDDILAAFFTLAALRELLKPADSRPARWVALLFFTLAVYSKESAVPFAVVPFLIYRCVHKLPWRECGQRAFLFLFMAFVYMLHRGFIIERNSQTAPLSGSYAQTLLDMLPVVPKYFRLLWGVPPFLIDYRFLKGGYTVTSPEVLLGALLFTLLVIGGIWAWRSRAFRPAGFGLLWTGLFLLPVANVLPMMQYMAERFLYLPLIGWLITTGTVGAVFPRKRIAQLSALLLVGLWGATAVQRSFVWRDEVTLFVSSYLEGPYVPRVEKNAAAAILYQPQIRRAFSYDPGTDKLTCVATNDAAFSPELLSALEQATRIFPENFNLIAAYGISLARSGRPEKALYFFAKAARLRPQNSDCWLNLARAALQTGRLAQARAAAGKAAALSPDQPAGLQFQAELEWAAGDFPAARTAVLRWRKIAPNDENARFLAAVDRILAGAAAPPPPALRQESH